MSGFHKEYVDHKRFFSFNLFEISAVNRHFAGFIVKEKKNMGSVAATDV